jgi:hypothetical protein
MVKSIFCHLSNEAGGSGSWVGGQPWLQNKTGSNKQTKKDPLSPLKLKHHYWM